MRATGQGVPIPTTASGSVDIDALLQAMVSRGMSQKYVFRALIQQGMMVYAVQIGRYRIELPEGVSLTVGDEIVISGLLKDEERAG